MTRVHRWDDLMEVSLYRLSDGDLSACWRPVATPLLHVNSVKAVDRQRRTRGVSWSRHERL